MKKKIFWVLFFGFLIRLIALDQSLWLDEAVTANVVSNYSYSEIITRFSPTDFHPPLFYLVEKFWTNIFGISEIALRFPSIIFSLITAWILYKIAGNWAAALFLFNPLIIYYSQEARPYMMVTMFVTLIIYYLSKITGPVGDFFPVSARDFKKVKSLRAVGSPFISATRNIILANVFIFLSLLAFYGSVFFIAAIYLWLLFKRQFKLLFLLIPGFILAVILISPLFFQQYSNSQIALSSVANWDLVLGKANLKNLLLIPIKFSIGRISFEPKILYWLIAGIWTTFVFFFVIMERAKRAIGSIKKRFYQSDGHRTSRMTEDSIFLWLFFVPLFLGFVLSFFTPMLQYFRFLYLIPLTSLLLAMPKTARPTRSGNWHVWVILAGFVCFSLVYLLNPAYHREDWKSLVKNLNTKSVYMIPSSSDPVKYYDKNIEIKSLKEINEMKLENEITVIPYAAEIHGVNYERELRSKNYELRNERSYRELKVEYWNLSKM